MELVEGKEGRRGTRANQEEKPMAMEELGRSSDRSAEDEAVETVVKEGRIKNDEMKEKELRK